MRKFSYKNQQVLLKDLYALDQMNKNRVDRLLEHHKIGDGGDVTDIMNISAWHAISARKTGGRFLFRGEQLTYTEISKCIPLGIRAITERIKNSGLNFNEDVSHLFSEIAEDGHTETPEQLDHVATLIKERGLHPYEAWTAVKGQTKEWLTASLGHDGKNVNHLFKAKKSSLKTMAEVAKKLGISQAEIRDSFSIYNEYLSKQHKQYCETVADLLACESKTLIVLPEGITQQLSNGSMPVEAIKEHLNFSNEEFAMSLGISYLALLQLKKVKRPQNKTIASLSKVSNIEQHILRKVFAICRLAIKKSEFS